MKKTNDMKSKESHDLSRRTEECKEGKQDHDEVTNKYELDSQNLNLSHN